LFLAALAASCFGQQWEFGGMGGAGFLSNVNVSSPAGSATAGFQTGRRRRRLSSARTFTPTGAANYATYLQNDLHIQSGGDQRHLHRQRSCGALRHPLAHQPQGFAHAGLRGGRRRPENLPRNRAPEAYQPNYQFGYMTKTQQLKPMGDVGAGLRFELRPGCLLRTEFRDYITPFPESDHRSGSRREVRKHSARCRPERESQLRKVGWQPQKNIHR
jgi:hypothetical protein